MYVHINISFHSQQPAKHVTPWQLKIHPDTLIWIYTTQEEVLVPCNQDLVLVKVESLGLSACHLLLTFAFHLTCLSGCFQNRHLQNFPTCFMWDQMRKTAYYILNIKGAANHRIVLFFTFRQIGSGIIITELLSNRFSMNSL